MCLIETFIRCLFIIMSAPSDIVPAVILKLCWTFYRLQMPDNYNAVIYGVRQVGVTQSNTRARADWRVVCLDLNRIPDLWTTLQSGNVPLGGTQV